MSRTVAHVRPTPPTGHERYSISLPGSAASIPSARVFAAAVAARFECDVAAIEDLKLGVSEACTLLVREGSELLVEIAGTGPRLGCEVRSVGPAQTIHKREPPWGLELIRALYQDAEIDLDSGAPFVRFDIVRNGSAPKQTEG